MSWSKQHKSNGAAMNTKINHTWQNKVLILFAHPMIHRSNVNKALIAALKDLDNITIHDLYAAYPDFYIDIKQEQTLLYEHDVIVFQFPFYWYSTPAILKIWQDLVLQHGFAHGADGNALAGKYFMSVTSTGAAKNTYTNEGINRYTVKELLRPIEQMARFTGMHVIPPYIVYGTHRIHKKEILSKANDYRELIIALRDNQSCAHLESNKGAWSQLLAKLTGRDND
ncbi:MAG: NAD(P)H oxidoreductase [Gammaproteobacteria bacterium]|nr:MAG: NAD(P)H oxidoreductase [Gammaproteobacteria bacterium]